jgi:polyisoprenyl-phosphate glycosyltransferase
MLNSTERNISILTPCRNERDNVRELRNQVRAVMSKIRGISYRHLFIDNASTDGTQVELRRLCSEDDSVMAIFNQRNFGHVRSPYHGLLQVPGEAVVVIAADLQDPPAIIFDLVNSWREGNDVVLGQKTNSAESPLFFAVRKAYYRLVKRLADVDLLENVTGFGLYDRKVVEALRGLDDPYPYVRGLISELGFTVALVPYEQPKRVRGITKNNSSIRFTTSRCLESRATQRCP